ncbi:MAG: PEP-CTERM sorting domain-containing protein [Gammaproteobacteria bacterium]
MRKIALATACLLCTLPAFAEVVTFEYTGVFNTIREEATPRSRRVAESAIVPGSIRVGDSFHGRFSYETSVTLTPWVENPQWASFYNDFSNPIPAPATTFVVDKSGTTIVSSIAAPSLTAYDNSNNRDFVVDPIFKYVPNGYGSVSFDFFDDTGALLPALAAPTSLDLDALYSADARLVWSSGGKTVFAEGMLTSLTKVSPVPEPASYILLFVGLAIVAGGASRSNRNRIDSE